MSQSKKYRLVTEAVAAQLLEQHPKWRSRYSNQKSILQERLEPTQLPSGKKLYRIEALKDFGNVKKGDFGGYVEKETNLSQDGNAWVYSNPPAFEESVPLASTRVFGDVRVEGDAQIRDSSWVRDNARITGSAIVRGKSVIGGNVKLGGTVKVNGGNDTVGVYMDGDVELNEGSITSDHPNVLRGHYQADDRPVGHRDSTTRRRKAPTKKGQLE